MIEVMHIEKQLLIDLPKGHKRPAEFQDGVAVISNIPYGQHAVFIFFEHDITHFYVMWPDVDTMNRIKDGNQVKERLRLKEAWGEQSR